MNEKNITASLEDYLEAIYVLENKNDNVRITDIAEYLKLSKPSVNRAVSTLKKSDYLEHESYGTIALTDVGRDIAIKVLKRHTEIKNFLTEFVGVSEEVAEEDACKIEHVISSETFSKLEEFIQKLKNN